MFCKQSAAGFQGMAPTRYFSQAMAATKSFKYKTPFSPKIQILGANDLMLELHTTHPLTPLHISKSSPM